MFYEIGCLKERKINKLNGRIKILMFNKMGCLKEKKINE